MRGVQEMELRKKKDQRAKTSSPHILLRRSPGLDEREKFLRESGESGDL